MKIYIIGGNAEFLESVKKELTDSGQTDVTTVVASKISPEDLAARAEDCEILVASPSGFEKVTREHMQALLKLKFISTTSVGTDWVDLSAAKEFGIIVSNEKGVNAEAVAQHCFGFILDLSKRISEADRDIREKGENRSSPYMGVELYGKTLGIIGTGDIGQRVARIAGGFSMKVLGANKTGKEVPSIEIVSFEKLLKESDVIAVTLPYNPETENLLSEKEFARMKNGVILVSISREKIINKEAVLKAVMSGKVIGFATDLDKLVKLEKDDAYLQPSRVIVTPHSASMTEEADHGYATMTVENINAFIFGKPVRVVN